MVSGRGLILQISQTDLLQALAQTLETAIECDKTGQDSNWYPSQKRLLILLSDHDFQETFIERHYKCADERHYEHG